jgi:long-chain fatty acid transport protein
MNAKIKNTYLSAGKWILQFCATVTFLTLALGVRAEGFRNATIGTWDLGRSGGRIAQVDDASSVQQNPANMLAVTNAQLQFTPSIIYINVDYKSPAGETATTIHPWKVLPNFFATVPLLDDRIVAGFGVTVPYGLANSWDSTSPAFRQPTGNLAYAAPYYSKLETFNFNPSVAVKLSDKFRFGAGLDVMWSQLEFKQFLSPFVPNLQAHAVGTGVGIGGNAGITWLITDKQSLALTYRSTMTVDYSGSAEFDGIPNDPHSPSTSFNSQIKYPNIIAAGYGIKLTDTVRLESDFEWLQFSQFKNLPINIGSNPADNPLGVPSQNIPQDWHNTFTAGIGGDWQCSEHWVVRGGYQYFESPVPDATLSPTIPDANQNVMTLGLGWKSGHSTLELSYGLDFYDDRNITQNQNPAFNGKYTFTVHLFSVGYTYSF